MSITIGDALLNYKIKIGDTLLNYKIIDKYIITYIEEYNTDLDTNLNNIFNGIFPHYASRSLEYSNVCGGNAKFICKNLKISGLTLGLGKIIITEWVTRNENAIKQIESVYGSMAYGESYHALVYLIIEKTYHVAIETTSCVPYKLQFYVGSNESEFEKIIKTCYQCSNFKISLDCEKSWTDIAYSSGGKKTKKLKNKKNEKTKKRKQKMGVLNQKRCKKIFQETELCVLNGSASIR
jgi:hypothetical protein